jgi:hypothetical protein
MSIPNVLEPDFGFVWMFPGTSDGWEFTARTLRVLGAVQKVETNHWCLGRNLDNLISCLTMNDAVAV